MAHVRHGQTPLTMTQTLSHWGVMLGSWFWLKAVARFGNQIGDMWSQFQYTAHQAIVSPVQMVVTSIRRLVSDDPKSHPMPLTISTTGIVVSVPSGFTIDTLPVGIASNAGSALTTGSDRGGFQFLAFLPLIWLQANTHTHNDTGLLTASHPRGADLIPVHWLHNHIMNKQPSQGARTNR